MRSGKRLCKVGDGGSGIGGAGAEAGRFGMHLESRTDKTSRGGFMGRGKWKGQGHLQGQDGAISLSLKQWFPAGGTLLPRNTWPWRHFQLSRQWEVDRDRENYERV